jgi:formimidoylglutamate deiminase
MSRQDVPAIPATYGFDHVLTPGGWRSPGSVSVGEDGTIVAVGGTVGGDAVRMPGFALPGMPNLHSHTFQRALGGFAEPSSGRSRDFWTWRETMYDLALRVDPDDVEAIAAQAFVEMLRGGFTSVAEFHYLHNQPDGTRYASPWELGERILAAATATGVGLTLLPTLYMHGGIGRALEPGQRRFASASVDVFLALVADLDRRARAAGARVGVAPHSIRAVAEDELRDLLGSLAADVPIHIHVAEQSGEVDQAMTAHGLAPAAFLADRFGLDVRWTLIHCTYCTREELAAIAAAGARVGLCPLSEAHLADGLFPLPTYEALDGAWGVGTDANTSANAATELQVLEYGQRLALGRRAVHDQGDGHVGDLLYRRALAGGAAALAQPIGALAPGRRADLLHVAPDAPGFEGHGPRTFLDAWLVRGGASAPTNVMVAGRWVVREGRHVDEDRVRERFTRTMRRLR